MHGSRRAMGMMASFALASTVLSGGCQVTATKPSPDATHGAPTTQAVACDKCKVVWKKEPMTAGGGHSDRVIGYTTQKQMVCPECRNAVTNMFTTGRFEHTCSACGGNIQACAEH
jgi:hypothetical protein